MPLAQPGGSRNWGYDGVLPFAPQYAYGTPDELKAFVDAAHARGLSVLLDVVYNHFGPEGNYLAQYAAPFFTTRHHTPWGAAINVDGPGSETVRELFVQNALFWLREYRFDGLRLDAVHEIRDESPRPFLAELVARVRVGVEPGRHIHLVLENDANRAQLLTAYDAQWNDDAHHAFHVLTTGETDGYYRDFARAPARLLGRALAEGFAFQGEASEHRGGTLRGEPSAALPATAFVDFLQNHDQIGNRALGERISALAPEAAVRAATAVLLLAPAIPLLFMGEEWSASTPFAFFSDFLGDLGRAVTEGRRREFAAWPAFSDAVRRARIPDPQDPATLRASTLRWEERSEPQHAAMLALHAELLALRAGLIVPRLAHGAHGEGYQILAPATPRTTYRLQFHAGFTFADATALIPYLSALGITHVYASPYLRARSGSTHGYDIVDHDALNPEVGTPDEYHRFVETLRAHGMGHILDFVPNHMGVGGDDNAWWLDLLTWGEESHYADYFDVDWNPLRAELRGKILLPFLGRQYGEVLDAGELHWEFVEGGFALRYYEHRFPLAPPTYDLVLDGAEPRSLASFAPLFKALGTMSEHVARRDAAASLRRLLAETEAANARAHVALLDAARTTPEGKELIERVVDVQHWRPSSWQVAAEEINYRRFFDINALAALRMENANCFGDTHRVVFDLIARGEVDGLRIDHVDGLFDPIGYCDLLRSRAEVRGEELYLIVEKILAPNQELLRRWHVDGTTGYEFMNAVTGLAVAAHNERPFDRLYQRFARDTAPFQTVAHTAKKFVLETALSGELNVLALGLDRIAQRDAHTRDFTLGALRRALLETIAAFPIYRTYVTGSRVEAADRLFIERAIAAAQK